MRLRSLRFPDLAYMHADPHYSHAVRARLTAAYAYLNQAPALLKNYADSMAVIEPILHAPMSCRQRIRVHYVAAMAHAAVGDFERSLDGLDQAVDLAYAQGDAGDLLDLLYLHGSNSRALLHYGEAARDYREYLAVAEGSGLFNHDSLDFPITVDVFLQLAGAEFFQGNYIAAQEVLEVASPLLPAPTDTSAVPELQLAAGTYAWFQALVHRWRGAPELALLHAATATRIYTAVGSMVSAGRSQLLTAEIALDVAEKATYQGERRFLALVAQPHLDHALQLAKDAGDPNGASLCLLDRARMSRIAGIVENRAPTIEGVARQGQRLGDDALSAHAFTLLGQELEAQGELEAALHRYRDVFRLLEGSDVPALGVWARRAAHRLTEAHPDL